MQAYCIVETWTDSSEYHSKIENKMIPTKKETLIIQQTSAPCDLGWLVAATTAAGLCFLALGDSAEELEKELAAHFPGARIVPAGAETADIFNEISAFINGESRKITLPLDLRGTPFQRQVWEALTTIPFGSTLSYTELAERIGRPKSVRAVANACGANPVGVIVPCHRVIRRDGSLGGYRGGIARKKLLLEREQQP